MLWWLLLACTRTAADTEVAEDTDIAVDTDTGTPEDTDTDAPIDTDTGGDTDETDTDTGLPVDPFLPYAFFVSGQFTVFADGAIGTATNRGTDWPPLVRVELIDERYLEDGDEAWSCTVEMIATSAPVPSEWAFTDDWGSGSGDFVHHGFVLPPGAETTSDCPAEVDSTAVVAWDWGVGAGTMRPDLVQELIDLGEDPADYYGAGAWIGDPAHPMYTGINLGFGFEIDETGELARDEDGYGIRIDTSTVGDGALQPGFYQVLAGYGVEADALFP